MTVILFFAAALLGGIRTLVFIRGRFEKIKEGIFYQVCASLEKAYRQTIEDIDYLDLDTASARRLFEKRANRVVDIYWLQFYGGREVMLHWEYATFRQIIGRFGKLISRYYHAAR